jgi:hypothetical protein
LDSEGNIKRQAVLDLPESSDASDIAATSDGGYVVVGDMTSGPEGGPWAAAMKTDAMGKILWTKLLRGGGGGVAYSVTPTQDGGCVIAGSVLESDPYGEYLWVFRLDAGGSLVWQRILGADSYSNRAFSVEQSADGGFLVAGVLGEEVESALMPGFSVSPFVLKLSPTGGTVRIRSARLPLGAEAHAAIETSQGGVVLVGGTKSLAPAYSDFLVLVWAPPGIGCRLVGIPAVSDRPLSVAVVRAQASWALSQAVVHEEPLQVSPSPAESRLLCPAESPGTPAQPGEPLIPARAAQPRSNW